MIRKDIKHFVYTKDALTIWNTKICFIEECARTYKSKYTFWIDAALPCKSSYEGAIIPDEKRIDLIFKDHQKQLLFQNRAKMPINNQEISPIVNEPMIRKFDFVLAGFFGGPSNLFSKFKATYFKIHDQILEQNTTTYCFREELILMAYLIYYPEDSMYFYTNTYKSKICGIWDAGLNFIGHENRCHHKNVIGHFDKYIKNNKTYTIAVDKIFKG